MTEDDLVLAKLDAADSPLIDRKLDRSATSAPNRVDGYVPRIVPKARWLDPPVLSGQSVERLSTPRSGRGLSPDTVDGSSVRMLTASELPGLDARWRCGRTGSSAVGRPVAPCRREAHARQLDVVIRARGRAGGSRGGNGRRATRGGRWRRRSSAGRR